MTYQEMVIFLQDPINANKIGCEKCYEFMLPILTESRCRKISKRAQDARVIQIFNGAFRKYWNILHQHPQEYWRRLELLGNKRDFEEFQFLKQRKQELKEAWKTTFATAKRKKTKPGSTDTEKAD